ncbi:hypothetical protein KCU95_g83, partial [Aureobasidium melanogenum]
MRSLTIRPIMVEIDRGGPESASERCDDRIWYQTDGRYLGSETNVEGSYKWQLCRMFPCLLSLSRQLLTRCLGMISLWASRPPRRSHMTVLSRKLLDQLMVIRTCDAYQ